MTVDPGFAGQPFIPEMLDKLAELKAWREREGLEYACMTEKIPKNV